jgi:type I restriction enzyme S subunit
MAKYKLGEICEIVSGSTPKTSVEEYWNGDVKWITPAELNDDSYIITDSARKITEEAVKKTGLNPFPEGTVILSSRAPIGKVAIAGCEMYCNQGFKNLICSDMINNKYLYWFLKGNTEFLNSLGRGATFKEISKQIVSNIEINVPDEKTQIRAVENLEKLYAIIRLRKEELTKLDELIKARFVEMFGDINVNDKGWDIQQLGELCTIVRGGSPRPIEKYLGGDVPWIKIGDATVGESIYLNSTKEHIIQEGMQKSRLVKAGSLIFANCGVSLGFARIITFDGCIHDGWLAMEDIDERLNKIFLLQSLNHMTEHFRHIAPAGTQPNLNTAIMKAYKQVIPPMELQNEFITFVQQVDKSKVAVQKALDETQLLFNSLMQEYFG